ncbi:MULTISPECIES: hypothetical protein [unclassified Mycobacterium]|uniref:hypothetical protein n=1 Tax=unclassified Mycobacterium TaxID=2642494 RepID=UPI0029C748C5|nr:MULTISPECIES: hypothetical protein [unclassified Mycobacterium]
MRTWTQQAAAIAAAVPEAVANGLAAAANTVADLAVAAIVPAVQMVAADLPVALSLLSRSSSASLGV